MRIAWLRLYSDILDNPKIMGLPDKLFRNWTLLLCVANRGEPRGKLPPAHEIAFYLRLPEKQVESILKDLQRLELLDVLEDGLYPHEWHKRQYDHDSSTARSQAHRARKRLASEECNVAENVSCNVAENVSPLYTDRQINRYTETDRQTAEPKRVESASQPAKIDIYKGLDRRVFDVLRNPHEDVLDLLQQFPIEAIYAGCKTIQSQGNVRNPKGLLASSIIPRILSQSEAGLPLSMGKSPLSQILCPPKPVIPLTEEDKEALRGGRRKGVEDAH